MSECISAVVAVGIVAIFIGFLLGWWFAKECQYREYRREREREKKFAEEQRIRKIEIEIKGLKAERGQP